MVFHFQSILEPILSMVESTTVLSDDYDDDERPDSFYFF